MLQISNLIGAAVANQSGAMEADTISKNGRSSKSLMSRTNFLSKACIVLLAAGFIFSGCKKDDDEIPSSAFDGKLTAKVENASEFASASKIMARTWSGAEIATATCSGGSFTLTLPPSPEAKFLKEISSALSDLIGLLNLGTEFSFEGDINPKCVIVDTFEAYDGSNNWVADLVYAKLGNPSSTYTNYIYVDMDIKIDGSTSEGVQISISLKKGWNTVYVTYNSTTDKEAWSTKEVSGLKWFFDGEAE